MKLYNTLTRSKEELKPLIEGEVSLYTCGLTVYSQPHIGNWVAYVYWDILQRALEAEGYKVNRIQNITDVGHLVSDDDSGEDKMEKGAQREGTTAWEVAEKYIAIAEHEGYELLGLKRPPLVRATDCISEQIAFVQDLEEKGYTYEIDGEGVYFDTSKLDDYGKLARLDISGLEEGARVQVKGKKNPTDFALWKFSPSEAKRDMEWDSPWGKGFPGWHLECSVIARENLGDQIDIHTGGIDHIPVHHTNEIAQTESVTDTPFASFWVHNNHIKIDGGKMSKSKGNIYTLQDILKRGYEVQAYKLLLASKHYRTEGNFSWDILEAAQNRLDNWRRAAAHYSQLAQQPEAQHAVDKLIQSLHDALSDDLDTPDMLARIDEFISEHEVLPEEVVVKISQLLGINLAVDDLPQDLQSIIALRKEARETKDWGLSDTLRDVLRHHTIEILDTKDGVLWSKNGDRLHPLGGGLFYSDLHRSITLYDLQLKHLPTVQAIDDLQFTLKQEFHVTICSLKKIAPCVNSEKPRIAEKELLEKSKEYFSKHPIDNTSWSFTHEVRRVRKGEEQSIIVLLNMPAIEKFFEYLRGLYAVEIPTQPAHITLYTHNSPHGIGINSSQELAEVSKLIDAKIKPSLR